MVRGRTRAFAAILVGRCEGSDPSGSACLRCWMSSRRTAQMSATTPSSRNNRDHAPRGPYGGSACGGAHFQRSAEGPRERKRQRRALEPSSVRNPDNTVAETRGVTSMTRRVALSVFDAVSDRAIDRSRGIAAAEPIRFVRRQ